jgi:hypothetical protein
MRIHSPQITGSAANTNIVTTTQIGSLSALSASYAATASYSNALTVSGTITAQTLVVQTITSSVDFITGSARFGSTTGNTHQFTGSVLVSGSQSIDGTLGVAVGGVTELNVQQTGVTLGNVIGDIHRVTGSLNLSGSLSTTSTATFGSSVTATSFEVGNGQYFKARRNSSNLLLDLLGIESGTDDTRLLITGDFNITNGSLTKLMTVKTSGNIGINTSTVAEGTQAASSLSIFPSSSVSGGPLIQFPSNGRIRPALTSDRLSIDGNALFLNGTFSSTVAIATGGGNVGVGTSSPSTKLHVASLNSSSLSSAVPALGFANSSSVALFTNGDVAYGTLFGTMNTGVGWIQQQRVDGTGTAYSLSLQPNGGNVGIGITTPSSTLTVNGNASIGANLTPSLLPHGLNTNARALVIAGSGSNPNYGALFLTNNSAEATDTLLGTVLYAQTVSGKSGTNAATKAGISVFTVGSGGSVGGFGGYMAFYTRPDNAASDIGAYEAMRITSGGLLRINSTSVAPNDSVYKLSVRMTTNRNVAFGTQGGDASIEAFNDAITENVPLRIYASPLNFVGANVKMFNNGANYNENIRTYPASNGYSSYILGAVSADVGSGTGQWSIVRWPAGNGYQFTIRYDGTDILFLYTNGNYSFAGSNVSDARKKTNITYIEDNQLDTIMKLKPATFSKVNPAMYSDSDEIVVNNNTHTGFIAQDVLAENIPNVLTGSDEEGYGLDYDGILSLAVKAIQELSAKNDALEARIAALETA